MDWWGEGEREREMASSCRWRKHRGQLRYQMYVEIRVKYAWDGTHVYEEDCMRERPKWDAQALPTPWEASSQVKEKLVGKSVSWTFNSPKKKKKQMKRKGPPPRHKRLIQTWKDGWVSMGWIFLWGWPKTINNSSKVNSPPFTSLISQPNQTSTHGLEDPCT